MRLLVKLNQHMIISQAFTCKEALELFSSFNPETVILDIDLPDGSGINLLQMFKKINPIVNVIIFTNYSSSDFREASMNLQASDFIDKSDILSLIKYMKYNLHC